MRSMMASDVATENESAGPYVRLGRRGQIRVITLARPERHNALVPELIDGVRAGLAHAATDPEAKAVVITARGRTFSTGGDVAAFAAYDGAELVSYARRIVHSLNQMILALVQLDIPVVTAVRGAVTGGSLGFLLASDAVILAADAVIAPYYVDVGFSADGGWTALLPQRIGHARAGALQYANDRLDAQRAVDWGLALAIAEGDVDQAALDLAERYAAKKPGAMRRTKALLSEDPERLADRLEAELESFVDQIQTDEAKAGMHQFLHRTQPRI